jgi:hypothetical protein
MTNYPQKRRLALVLAESTAQRHWQERELAREGYEVRCFRKAWDALAMFGTEMPDIGVIGQAQDTECLELLIEDLERYGVPVTAVEPSGTRCRRTGPCFSHGHVAAHRNGITLEAYGAVSGF